MAVGLIQLSIFEIANRLFVYNYKINNNKNNNTILIIVILILDEYLAVFFSLIYIRRHIVNQKHKCNQIFDQSKRELNKEAKRSKI